MRYLLSVEQKVFFRQNQLIELEDFFAPEKLQGEDLKKLARDPQLLFLAGEFFDKKMLKLAIVRIIDLPYKKEASHTLQEVSCIQGLVGACMIGIEGTTGLEANQNRDPFPQKEGSVVFFLPNKVWEKEALEKRPQQKCLLIAFGDRTMCYTYNDKDPELLNIRKMGYSYGDRLSEEHFPLFSTR